VEFYLVPFEFIVVLSHDPIKKKYFSYSFLLWMADLIDVNLSRNRENYLEKTIANDVNKHVRKRYTQCSER